MGQLLKTTHNVTSIYTNKLVKIHAYNASAQLKGNRDIFSFFNNKVTSIIHRFFIYSMFNYKHYNLEILPPVLGDKIVQDALPHSSIALDFGALFPVT